MPCFWDKIFAFCSSALATRRNVAKNSLDEDAVKSGFMSDKKWKIEFPSAAIALISSNIIYTAFQKRMKHARDAYYLLTHFGDRCKPGLLIQAPSFFREMFFIAYLYKKS